MTICFFLIDDHLVVTKQITSQLHPHFIRGEKATSIAGWQLAHWQQFKAYLLGSLGIETANSFNFCCYQITDHTWQLDHLQHCFANVKMKFDADFSNLYQYQFCPLQFKLTINEQAYDFLAFINSAIENKSTPNKKANTKTKNNNTVKPKAQAQAQAQQPVKTKHLIKVKPVYDLASLYEIKHTSQSPLVQGVVSARRGSGFVVMVNGFELFVNYLSLNKLTSSQKKNTNDFIPAINTKLMVEINDKEIFVLLPNRKTQVKENS